MYKVLNDTNRFKAGDQVKIVDVQNNNVIIQNLEIQDTTTFENLMLVESDVEKQYEEMLNELERKMTQQEQDVKVKIANMEEKMMQVQNKFDYLANQLNQMMPLIIQAIKCKKSEQ